MKKKVDLIITDLDNTLFDWFKPWYRAYDQMISDISDKSKINRSILIAEIKKYMKKPIQLNIHMIFYLWN